MSATPPVAAIAIGRNEGARLIRCLESLAQSGLSPVIYVDSGSTDGSVAAARARGAEVVELDMSRPFTAARARNAGLERLAEIAPDRGFVQLLDGDCELRDGWIEAAFSFLQENEKVAIACGRRRERFPEASLYNAQCDREWDRPAGETSECGGDALMRVAALRAVGGYDPRLIAGEEPEMCLRMRKAGWVIWRLGAEMTWHDAAMVRFSQFWKRARRAGHAFAEGAYLHGAAPWRHYVEPTRRALIWGAGIPLAILALALIFGPVMLGLVAIYPLQVLRLARRGGGTRAAWEEAALLTVSKFAEALGVIEFHLRRLSGRRSGLIEYK